MTSELSELGALLVLLHGAESPFATVQATYRIWRHEARQQAAFLADAEELKRRVVSITTYAAGDGEPDPLEREETIRLWRAGDRVREERDGGYRDGYYAVAHGRTWWCWDEQNGALSNQDDPEIGMSSIGQELQVLLSPVPLLSLLRFEVTGNSNIAGRATISARATARRDHGFGPRFELHQLGTGATQFELEIDQGRGALLAVVAIHDNQPFQKMTALAIEFDRPIADEVFQFEPPEGERIRGPREEHRVHRVTVAEAQQLAPFTVLMPDRVATGWRVGCRFVERSERPPSPAQVGLICSSDDGHESFSISQMALADRDAEHSERMLTDDSWRAVTHDGRQIKVRTLGGQAQAHLAHEGTWAFLMSNNLSDESLVKLAAGLRPAPSTSSI